MSLDPDLVRLLKRLKLGALAPTLPADAEGGRPRPRPRPAPRLRRLPHLDSRRRSAAPRSAVA